MSLLVHAYVLDDQGERHLLDPPAPGGDLAGFEQWRTTVWGSAAVRALGARYFPVLDQADLTVAVHEVAEFRDECALLRTHLAAIAPQADRWHTREWYVDTVSERLAHIEAVAEQAVRVGGGVLIW